MTKRSTFLHSSCKAAVCEDCRLMAEEYTELLERRTFELVKRLSQFELMQFQLEQAHEETEFWKEVASAGMSEIINRWLKSESEKAFRRGRAEERKRQAQFEQLIKDTEVLIKKTKGRLPAYENNTSKIEE